MYDFLKLNRATFWNERNEAKIVFAMFYKGYSANVDLIRCDIP